MLRRLIIATALSTALVHSAQAAETVPVAIAKDIHDGYFRRALVQLRPLMDVHADALSKSDKAQELQPPAQEAAQNDDPASAEALFKRAVELNPATASLVSLGIFYTEQKRYNDAFQAFHSATAKDAKAYSAC